MSAKDYLWEKKGEGDAGTKQLESLLGTQRFSGMTFPAEAKPRRTWPLALGGLALAAALALVFVLPRGEALSVFDGVTTSPAAVGQWLTTTDRPVTLTMARDIGTVEVAPHSRVRVRRVDAEQQRLELEQGKLHASVLAPPRLFVVDTPAATAVDLGCEYTLEVEADGASRLDVRSGRVVLAGAGVEVTVPEGMWSRARPGQVPQVAVDSRASPALVTALATAERDADALDLLLAQADRRDAVTLFQLKERLQGDAKEKTEARLQALLHPAEQPKGSLWDACLSAREGQPK